MEVGLYNAHSGFKDRCTADSASAGTSWASLTAAALARNKLPNRLIIGNHGEPRACGHGRHEKNPCIRASRPDGLSRGTRATFRDASGTVSGTITGTIAFA